MSSFLVVGLGNPGAQYEKTRHNIGWLLLDELVDRWSLSLKNEQKYKAMIGRAQVGAHKVWVCKPLTYMNLSGNAVQPLMAYYDIPIENLLVLVDEVNLNFGRARLRGKGSDGGQNGLKHIAQRLSSQNYARLRMGVGPQPQGRDRAGFVLSKFPKDQLEAMPQLMGVMADSVEKFIREGLEPAVAHCNSYRLPGFGDQ